MKTQMIVWRGLQALFLVMSSVVVFICGLNTADAVCTAFVCDERIDRYEVTRVTPLAFNCTLYSDKTAWDYRTPAAQLGGTGTMHNTITVTQTPSCNVGATYACSPATAIGKYAGACGTGCAQPTNPNRRFCATGGLGVAGSWQAGKGPNDS
jgi:hypothetical protein